VSDFLMPSLGADMEAGTLVEWQVAPGDRVEKGQVIAVVETAKGAIDVEVFESGVVEECYVAPDTKVPVGTPLARIGSGDRVVDRAVPVPCRDARRRGSSSATFRRADSRGAAPRAGDAATGARRLRQSPRPLPESGRSRRPRRRCADARVNSAWRWISLSGSGPGGAIVLRDLERAAGDEPRPEAPARRRLRPRRDAPAPLPPP
jgi:pyruvate dehydrogenase E2 component (dihydrolipoamide acetyltransferase)